MPEDSSSNQENNWNYKVQSLVYYKMSKTLLATSEMKTATFEWPLNSIYFRTTIMKGFDEKA